MDTHHHKPGDAGVTRTWTGLFLHSLLVLVVCVGVTQAQKKRPKLPKWKIDPYTKNDPKAMAKAGYVSYGPFGFGEIGENEVQTNDIEKELGKVKLIWVETAHFKIGSALARWPIPTDRAVKQKLRAELTELKKKIPKVKIKAKVLDRWLRLHLFAQRLENLYSRFQEIMKVTDADFPTKKGMRIKGRYMGEGPFLGQPAKYTVIMFQKESDYTRYLRTYIGMAQTFAKRHNFKIFGSLFTGTAAELYEGSLKHDTAMHCHIVFNVIQQLINGYRMYIFDMPVWFKEGMAHYFERLISRKYNDFDQNESSSADLGKAWKWKPKIRALVVTKNKKLKSWSEMLKWRDYGQIKFYDHMVLWGRMEFLFSRGEEGIRIYLDMMKGNIDPSSQGSLAKAILKVQRDAFRKGFGGNPIKLDELWMEHVKKTYPSR